MRILVLASDVPATISMPGSPRLFSLCRTLSVSHDLILATGSLSDERLNAFRSDSMNVGVFKETVILPGPDEPTWWGRQAHRLRQEVYFITRYLNREFHSRRCSQIRKLYADHKIDLVYADGLGMAQYVQDAGLECPAVIDLHAYDEMTASRICER